VKLPRAARLVLALVIVAAAAWLVVSVAGQPATVVPGRAPITIPQSGADDGEYGSATGVVDRVVDGDTVIIDIDGEQVRVRMLNIDTPESVTPDQPVECLGPEASDFTKAILPEGEEVTLQFDVERTDQYGRTLAAVLTEEGENVSVELARAGLARPVTFGVNDRFRPAVDDAVDEARAERVGLFDPDNGC
jgi:micrococcal nuclease